jgi:nucleotidyltransferase/DNA polymerase involved in DNA repair
MAGETGPKGSITQITQNNIDHYLATTAFADTCGIGYRLEKRLRAVGVENLYQIHLLTDEELQHSFGPYWSGQLRKMSQGEEPDLFQRIDINPFMKSVGRSITGYKLCDDELRIKQVLYNLVIEVTSKARQLGLSGRQISVYLNGEERYWYDHVTLPSYTNQTKEMFELVYEHLYKNWERSFKVIKFGVRLSMLQPEQRVLTPFWKAWQRRQKLEKALDKVTAKYGLFTLQPASLLGGALIRPEVTGWLGDKNYQLENR